MRQNNYEYDAFISHAVEDKIPIANELCAKLERAGLKIWYSGKELGVGDSIEKTIERGLNRSRYGIVIFSPTYLAKNWTIREFYTLLAKEIEEQKVILPVLYNITLEELKNKDLVMADRFAVNADKGTDFVVERLVREIKKSHVVKRKEAWFSKIWMVLILSLLANVAFLLKDTIFATAPPSGESSLSLASDEAINHPAGHQTLLGEMQGLFSQLNACTCNVPEKKDEPLLITSGTAGKIFNPFQNVRDGVPDHNANLRSGRKVTMALVFQVETPSYATPAPKDEMEDIVNALGPSEKKDPFITVTSLNVPHDQHSERCLHHSQHND